MTELRTIEGGEGLGYQLELAAPPAEGSRTLLQMRHTDQPAEALENHDAGWRFFLPRLAEAVAQK